MQFGDSVTDTGAPLWRIGSAAALAVNLEDCVGCGVAGWGWQDNASWTGDVARIRFATSGTHTIRVQVREDGVDVDQIVLSPLRWFSSPPGSLKNDTTIVAKPAPGGAVTLTREPYLQQVTSTSAIVAWATREPGPAEVRFQSDSGVSGAAAALTRLVPTAITGLPSPYYQHEATLTGLNPVTSYSYRLIVGGVDAGTVDRLTTAPPPGTGTVRFLAFGDSGIGSPEQRQLATRMTAEAFDLALHTGDVVYGSAATTGAGGYPQLQSWFFDIYRDWLRSRPMFPSIGNHDDEANRAAPYRDVFVLPPQGASAAYPDHAERFYSFDYGPAHVVVLDTELAFQDLARRSAQLSWLVDDLLRTNQPWKIAVFHRSPFSAGGEHGSDLTVRAEFVPIFEQYGVSLVLSGHEHDYERTIPWQQTPGGKPVTYVVTGGGGARLYPAAIGPWTAAARSAFHYVRGAISTCTISLEAVGLDTVVFDSTTLNRCASGPGVSTPYGGVPRAVPGTIQAEDFDEGGEGVAYRDSDAGNNGGAYRVSNVDVESSSDTGGGHNRRLDDGRRMAQLLGVRRAGRIVPVDGQGCGRRTRRHIPCRVRGRQQDRIAADSQYRWLAELDERHRNGRAERRPANDAIRHGREWTGRRFRERELHQDVRGDHRSAGDRPVLDGSDAAWVVVPDRRRHRRGRPEDHDSRRRLVHGLCAARHAGRLRRGDVRCARQHPLPAVAPNAWHRRLEVQRIGLGAVLRRCGRRERGVSDRIERRAAGQPRALLQLRRCRLGLAERCVLAR